MQFQAAALEGRTGLNRRLAPRRPVEGVTVDLLFQEVRRFGRRRDQRLPMRAVDLSIEGALLFGPGCEALQAGSVVTLEAGSRATAEIRHVTPRGGQALYGVRFVRMDQRFRDWLFAELGRDREDLEDAWRNAH